MSELEAFNFFVYRTPFLTTEEGIKLVRHIENPKSETQKLFEEVLKVLTNTTPEFIERYLKNPNGKNRQTLTQYILRMSHRATPFGLLAGIAVGTRSNKLNIVRAERDQWSFFHTDNGDKKLRKLIQESQRTDGELFLNPLLTLEKELIKVPKMILDKENKFKSYPLQEFRASKKVIKQLSGLKDKSLDKISLLKEFDEIQLNQLLEKQIILPALDYSSYLKLKDLIPWKKEKLESLNTQTFKDKNIILSPTFSHCEIDQQTTMNIAKAVSTLHELFAGTLMHLNSKTLTGRIHNEIKHRNNSGPIPLIDVLDPISGYIDLNDSRIDRELLQYKNTHELVKFYLDKIASSETRLEEWVLTADDIEKIVEISSRNQNRRSKLPSSMLSFIKLLPKGRVYLQSVYGMPSSRYLSRFGMVSAELEKGIDEITAWDKENNKDVILAEIIEWPDSINVANFGQRKITTDFILPVHHPLKHWPIDKQIFISDLYITCDYGRIRLRSKKLNTEIVPIFSSPSSLDNKINPYLLFLSELATQRNFPILNWMWNDLRTGPYLPRVRLGNVYLSLKAWKFTEAEHRKLLSSNDRVKDFLKIKTTKGIPDTFYWAEYTDQKLFVDCRNSLILNTFLNAYCYSQYSETSTIEEYIEGMENEVMLPLKNLTPIHQDPIRKISFDETMDFDHQYLFMKCYMNSQRWDHFLEHEINVFLETPRIKNKIKSWFFIKYFDPSAHIRFRILMKDIKDRPNLMEELAIFENRLINQKICWKFQIETYVRDEFTANNLSFENIEECYYLDSFRMLDLIKNMGFQQWTPKEKNRYALILMDYYLSFKDKTLDDKIFTTQKTRYAYRSIGYLPDSKTRASLIEIINDNKDLAINGDDFFKLHCETHLGKIAKILGPSPEGSIIQRLIHLALNRTLTGVTYLDEDMFYDALHRIYKIKSHLHEK